MFKLISYKKINLYFFLLLGSLLPIVLNFSKSNSFSQNDSENYRPNLSSINSMDKLLRFSDSTAIGNNIYLSRDTASYVDLCADIVEQRFHFGTAYYSIGENWIAFLLGKLFWSHFAAIVDANDLLKHTSGLCSQQTIVFIELLKNKGISYRTVGLGFKEGPGHFLCEVRYNNEWNLYDVSIEPSWSTMSNKNKSLEYYLQNREELVQAYSGKISAEQFSELLKKINYGEVNLFPAKNMLLVHHITFALTYVFPVLFSLLLYLSVGDRRNKPKNFKNYSL